VKFLSFLPLSWVALNLVGFVVALQPVGATLLSREAQEVTRQAGQVEERMTLLKERIRIINNRTEVKTAKVSFYSDYFHGRVTASGIRFDQGQRQVAHRSLPFGTIVVFTYGEANMGTNHITGDDQKPAGKVRGNAVPLSPRQKSRQNGETQSWGIVTDRGPFHRDKQGRFDREFDTSRLIMDELGGLESGVVSCEVLVIRKEK